MAVTNFSPLLGLALPTTGDLSGTWGTTVNNSITSLLDTAVAGTTTLSTDADVTLTTTNGSSNQARSSVLLWTASGTATRYITAPAQSKAYVVINATGSTQSIVIRGVGPTTGVTVPAGYKTLVAWNGSDFVKVSTSTINLTSDVTGTLPVANGGTGVTTSTGTGSVVLSTSPTLVTPILGTPTSGTLTNATGLPLTTGVTGVLPVANGGSGTSTPALVAGSNVTITGTWPNQTINASAPGTGTVTSVSGTGTVNGITLTGTVTSTGSLTLGGTLSNVSLTTQVTGTLPVANGGTGVTTSTGSGNNVLSTSPTLVTPILGTPTSGNLANCTFPTLNQNTTGSAGSVATTNFSIVESGGKLLFKYGGTTIASMDSSGNIIALANVTAYGTP